VLHLEVIVVKNRIMVIVWALVLLAFVISAIAYPRVPDRVASHWNARGEVDDTMGRFWGVFFLPLMLAGLVIFLIVIPSIDPLKANIAQFRGYYDQFILVFALFMLLVHLQVILWNLGIQISPNLVLPIGIAMLFFYLGTMMRHVKRNFFIGIRTPWTLSSDAVWEKTHQLGGRLFQAAGVLALLGAFFPSSAWLFVLVPAIVAALASMVYSYAVYRQLEREGTNQ
jgi:uncharacterized membrane protein